MIRKTCDQCQKPFPMNDTLRVEERILCDSCCDTVLKNRDESAPELDFERLNDPTVCVQCKQDFDRAELPLLAGVPVCTSCETLFRNYPFPPWIKLSLCAVVVFVLVSLFWNLRFFHGYRAFNRSFAFLAQGDVAGAAALMSDAARYVPESDDIRILACFAQGLDLLRQGKCRDALQKLEPCKGRLPTEYGVEDMILQARYGAAFNAEDYDGFLAISKEIEGKSSGGFMGKAKVASAYACKFAETGAVEYKEQSLAYLQAACDVAGGDPNYSEYEQRILHRLHTGEIITREEFYERFPDGWKQEREETN